MNSNSPSLISRLSPLTETLGTPLKLCWETPETPEWAVPVAFAEKNLGWICPSRALNPEEARKLSDAAAEIGALENWSRTGFSLDKIEEMDSLLRAAHEAHPLWNWTGIYLLEGDNLILRSYRGEPTPHPIIPKGQGICGAAVRENATVNIADVSADSRYLSCDYRTRSEIVAPIRNSQGEVIGEVDIDSHTENAFGSDAEKVVEQLAKDLERLLLQ